MGADLGTQQWMMKRIQREWLIMHGIMDMYNLYTPKCVQTNITTTTTTTKRRRNDLHFFSQLVSSISISSFFFPNYN
jgi:hypothetical protein